MLWIYIVWTKIDKEIWLKNDKAEVDKTRVDKTKYFMTNADKTKVVWSKVTRMTPPHSALRHWAECQLAERSVNPPHTVLKCSVECHPVPCTIINMLRL